MTAWNLPDGFSEADRLPEQLSAVAQRFNQEYEGKPFDLPEEVEAMPVFQDWAAGSLQAKVASQFWEVAKPKKNQLCLDLGCGLSFLVYPWRDWNARFYGQDISSVAVDALKARGPQLNSKLFNGIKKGPAHLLDYEDVQFDLVIATGVSCYYSLDYWKSVMTAVKPLLKPDGFFVFDAIDPDAPLAENWQILETYMGAEVIDHPLSDWDALIKAMGGKTVKQRSNDLFRLFKVKF